MLTRRLALAGLSVPLLLTTGGAARAEGAEPVSLRTELETLKRMIGRWKGTGEGEPGASVVERTYEVALGGQFLLARNQSSYAPQEKNPKGEVHQDMGLYSFDSNAQTIVLRQFHTEGFVNTYAAPAAGLSGDTLAFTTTAIENIPEGFRARETYRFSGQDAFEEIFEIAEPGKDFAVYSHNRLSRA